VLARQHFTQRYWQARFPNDPESFALYRKSALPPAEEAKMAADPEFVEATRGYAKAYALGLLRRATSEDDRQLAASFLRGSPPEVRSDPEVIDAELSARHRIEARQHQESQEQGEEPGAGIDDVSSRSPSTSATPPWVIARNLEKALTLAEQAAKQRPWKSEGSIERAIAKVNELARQGKLPPTH